LGELGDAPPFDDSQLGMETIKTFGLIRRADLLLVVEPHGDPIDQLEETRLLLEGHHIAPLSESARVEPSTRLIL
jgi:hypothetical protein